MLFFLLALLAPSTASAIFFGADNLLSYSQLPPDLKATAQSVAMMVPKNFVGPVKADGTRDLDLRTIGEVWVLRPDQRFANEPAFFVGCTGFLVGDDQMMTAGHCVLNHGLAENEPSSYCEAFIWLFGFHAGPDGSVQSKNIPADRFHECTGVIKAAHDSQTDEAGKVLALNTDLALVRLATKPNRPKLPLQVRAGRMGERLRMLGHGLGGPLLGSSGRVFSLESTYWRTSLDVFGGHSGSPVLSDQGLVVGVLVRAGPESVLYGADNLGVFNRCNELGQRCTADNQELPPGAHVQPILPAFLPR